MAPQDQHQEQEFADKFQFSQYTQLAVKDQPALFDSHKAMLLPYHYFTALNPIPSHLENFKWPARQRSDQLRAPERLTANVIAKKKTSQKLGSKNDFFQAGLKSGTFSAAYELSHNGGTKSIKLSEVSKMLIENSDQEEQKLEPASNNEATSNDNDDVMSSSSESGCDEQDSSEYRRVQELISNCIVKTRQRSVRYSCGKQLLSCTLCHFKSTKLSNM